MDLRDLFYIGSNMLDEVDYAVMSGDFSKLGSSLQEMSAQLQRDAEIRRKEQEDLRRRYQDQMRQVQLGQAGMGAGAGGSGQARSAAPSKRGFFTTPFLAKRISRFSGIGRIIAGGIVGVVSLILFATFLTLAITLSGAWMVGGVIFGALTAFMIYQIVKGARQSRLADKYYRYGSVLGNREYFSMEELARQTAQNPEQVRTDIKNMMRAGMLPQARLDAGEGTVMLTDQVYRDYLNAEEGRKMREAQERAQEAKKREAAEASPYGPQVQALLDEGEAYLAMVRKANDDIPGDQMSDKLYELEKIMDRIFAQVRKEPKSAADLRKFMNYYLPTTQKLLTAYVELDQQSESISNVANTKREIESAMDTINVAFEKLLDSLFEEVAWDVSSDISAMKTMMAQDGLTHDGLASQAAGSQGQAGSQVQAGGQAQASGQVAAGSRGQAQAVVQGGGMTLSFGQAVAEAAEEEKK